MWKTRDTSKNQYSWLEYWVRLFNDSLPPWLRKRKIENLREHVLSLMTQAVHHWRYISKPEIDQPMSTLLVPRLQSFSRMLGEDPRATLETHMFDENRDCKKYQLVKLMRNQGGVSLHKYLFQRGRQMNNDSKKRNHQKGQECDWHNGQEKETKCRHVQILF